ncbi:MAG: hypothetical protein WC848_05230 [Parcubacteria group bacterium]|jgi:ABC-type amino acid transport system permease subunit
MSEIQIFQLFGLTFFAIGMGMLVNPKFITNLLREFGRSNFATFFGGLISLAIGYCLIVFHVTTNSLWSLFITLMGWVALFKGLALLMFPVQTGTFYKKIIGKKDNSKAIPWFVIIIGLISLYYGYFA